MQLARDKPDARLLAQECAQHKRGGDGLRDDRCPRDTLDAHLEPDDKQQVEPRVDEGGDDKVVKRPLRIAHGAQNARSHVIQQ